ncbi:tripartite-type tricarboxylate transporter receptor subunit TctC [Paenibacillus sp. SORGH_AS306]|uniref:tripartite tricarboxylate transporter substrate binding protein n=1 Tax=unclassified Paenibacillus TaxID=185978 RepID=UPI0027874433|nr:MULTISPECIES: tripartite tricarboxylate transporter substrate binding protein [unclassified Paenibacillus]MDQ1236099.1 tripartite-type tricarboxylate transporter receptor subunit TctC [Paenibacillus sp. SORGH_AS_0306]MDR6108454.1 tripartite-type tricarboxylate transporter receptor subunit TctC [Paenibacillus sp. SORGH_AS_0338]
MKDWLLVQLFKTSKWKTAASLLATVIVVLGLISFFSGKWSGISLYYNTPSSFPTKPITLVVPYAVGGGTDITARALVQSTQKYINQPITVVNRTGGGGSIGLMEGANAKPDGYTITYLVAELTTLPHMGLLPITYEKYKPIIQTNNDPSAITVRADAPWKTAQQFLDYARTHPGQIKMGNAGTGSIWHLAAAMLEQATHVTFTHIPYEGAGPAVSALMSGFVDAVPVSPAEVKEEVDQGKLRILMINGSARSEAFPDVPTLQEATGYTVNFSGTWRGLAVPQDTPDEIVHLLAEAFTKGTKEQEFREDMSAHGLGLLVKDKDGFRQQMQQSHDLYARLIPELGLSRK